MKLKFFKYQGTGNDFIMIDNREINFEHHRPEILARLCDRRFGIGADGIIFLENVEGYDFQMVYYNSDGQPSSMCGNGGRCIVAFAKHLGIIQDQTSFLAVDGPHYAQVSKEGDYVSLQMIDVTVVHQDGEAYVLNTGSPHYVSFVSENLKEKDVFKEGKAIRNSENYVKEGININFVQDEGEGHFVRTYERGVEDETFACGTGATAVAIALAKHKGLTGNIFTPLRVLGGKLNIKFDTDGSTFTNVFLEGPAQKVFDGEIDL